MNILIIGGTRFVGRHIVQAALDAGHAPTLFNRGATNPGLFPDVEHIRGDRDGDLSALAGREWDAVVDTCGYVPRVVGYSLSTLSGAAGHYTYVSSVSVYASNGRPGYDESAPLGALADETVEQITGETYGPLKALCERAVIKAFGDRAFIPRLGLVVGPHDHTGRFTYWVRRVAEGGRVVAPGRHDRPVQFVDARDAAAWIVRAGERRTSGAFNTVCAALPMEKLLDACRAASGSDAEVVWVDEAFLLDRGVEPWGGLPLWIPQDDEDAATLQASNDRAVSAGLTTRPLGETVADTLAWDRAERLPHDSTLTRERERDLLAEWDDS